MTASVVPAGDSGRETAEVAPACTCGPGAWGSCDQCGVEAWVKHHCPFPCDDVTCEKGSLCIGCLTGRPCPMHNGDEWDDDWSDR